MAFSTKPFGSSHSAQVRTPALQHRCDGRLLPARAATVEYAELAPTDTGGLFGFETGGRSAMN